MATAHEAIWAFSEDILDFRKKFKEHLKAQVSQPRGIPLHRYKGQISLEDDGLLLAGKDKDSHREFRLLVFFKQIVDIYLGWDDVLRRWHDTRAWIRPLRVTFENHQKRVLYIYARKIGAKIYGRENKALYETLNNKIVQR